MIIDDIFKELNLTPYGISHQIAAETDCDERTRKRIEVRWQSWRKGENIKTLQSLEEDLKTLGFKLTIEKDESSSYYK